MKFSSTAFGLLERLLAGKPASPIVEKNIYVFINAGPVILAGSGDGSTRNAASSQAVPTVQDATELGEGAGEVELDPDLMWTWFLPNPLWPPKDQK